jgi:hypothetical protein
MLLETGVMSLKQHAVGPGRLAYLSALSTFLGGWLLVVFGLQPGCGDRQNRRQGLELS